MSKPIPVDAARNIAHGFEKRIVVIIGLDAEGMIHAATYGVIPDDKTHAALLGEKLVGTAGGFLPAAESFEDFRDAASNAKDLEDLKHAAWNLNNILRQADPTCTKEGHADYPLRIICDNDKTATQLRDALNELQRCSGWKPEEAQPV